MRLAVILAVALIFVSTPAVAWQVAYSPGVPKRLKNGQIKIPTVGNPAKCARRKHACPSVNYIWRGTRKKPGNIRVVFQIKTKGNPTFNYKLEPTNTCVHPAKASVILQKRGDNMWNPNGRFWAKEGALLKPGTSVYKVRMKRTNFINVVGKTPGRKAWNRMMSNMGRIGLTLGGGCFKGHGVNVSGGQAYFKLKKYRW